MVFTCIVYGCSKTSEPYVRTLHGFPDDLATVGAWKRFVRRTRADWDGQVSSSKICSDHFEPGCYKNHLAWSMRAVQKLELKDDFQVPTIYPAGTRRTAGSSAATAENDPRTDGFMSSIQSASPTVSASALLDSCDDSLNIVEEGLQPEIDDPSPPESQVTNQIFESSPSSSAAPLTVFAATPYKVKPGGTRSARSAADSLEEQLHRSKDVQQMLVIKEEEPDEWSSSLHHQDPELCIKEEEEELLTSPGGVTTSFPFTVAAVKSEDDIFKNKTEDCKDKKPSTGRSAGQTQDAKNTFGGSDNVRNLGPISHVKLTTDRKAADFAKTEVINVDNSNYEDWQIPLSDYGPESEDNNGGFKETEVPESDEFSDVGSNTAKQPFTCPKHTTDRSEKGSSSCLGTKKCPTVKPNVESQMEVHTGDKPLDDDVHGDVFNQKTLSNIDVKLLTGEGPFDCDVCGKTFSVKGSLNRHMRIHTGEKHFSCGVCCKRFIEKTDLKKHVKVHTGEKPFSCVFCGKTFRQKAHINRHMIIHKGDKPFVCDVCGKTFNVKANLNVHMRIHTGEKLFGCDVCGKTFSIKGNLNAHMRIHKGEKHFGCDICGKTFILKGNLTTHMRIHTGEKHFGCDVCGKTFVSKGNLDAHIKIHTGEKQFSCDVCCKRFILKTDLRKHMRVHTGEKPFSCGLCGKTFSQKIHLKTHMITHKEEKPLVVMFVVKHST
ncbi:zinc finger protein 79 [Kryptolebias marmoratus]|uniref:zinc finger protein 79 n=1 Tax=Kryptolebias marmoratus TaxID=37003 RepID=UPI0007F8A016|nr:zinc finger protein 79 [Kryptolebias marmoratus]